MKKLPKNWTTVTPFSRKLALLMFILFPIVAYFFGRSVQGIVDTNEAVPPAVCIPSPQTK